MKAEKYPKLSKSLSARIILRLFLFNMRYIANVISTISVRTYGKNTANAEKTTMFLSDV